MEEYGEVEVQENLLQEVHVHLEAMEALMEVEEGQYQIVQLRMEAMEALMEEEEE